MFFYINKKRGRKKEENKIKREEEMKREENKIKRKKMGSFDNIFSEILWLLKYSPIEENFKDLLRSITRLLAKILWISISVHLIFVFISASNFMI